MSMRDSRFMALFGYKQEDAFILKFPTHPKVKDPMVKWNRIHEHLDLTDAFIKAFKHLPKIPREQFENEYNRLLIKDNHHLAELGVYEAWLNYDHWITHKNNAEIIAWILENRPKWSIIKKRV